MCWMAIASGAAGGAGNMMGSTVGAIQNEKAAKQQAQALQYQAWLDEQRAAMAEKQGQFEQQKADKEQAQRMGRGLVAAAAGGSQLDSGSVVDWATGMAGEHAMEKYMIGQNADMQIWGYLQDANLQRWQARTLKKNARNQVVMAAFMNFSGLGGLGSAGSALSQMGNRQRTTNDSYGSPTSAVNTSGRVASYGYEATA